MRRAPLIPSTNTAEHSLPSPPCPPHTDSHLISLNPLTQIGPPVRIQSLAADTAIGHVEAEAPAGWQRGDLPASKGQPVRRSQSPLAAFGQRHLGAESRAVSSTNTWLPSAKPGASTERNQRPPSRLPRL